MTGDATAASGPERPAAGTTSVQVLGPVQVLVGGRPVPLTGRLRSIVAVLAASRGRPVSAAELAEELHPGSTARDPTAVVRVHLSNLRAAVGAAGADRRVVQTVGGGYVLWLPAGAVDAEAFEERCRRVRSSAGAEAALGAARAALRLWRGAAFEGCADLAAVRPAVARLQWLRRELQVHEAELLLDLGRHPEAVGRLEALVAQDPFDEALVRLLMLGLYRGGRPTEALGRAQELRLLLRHEHGTDPGPAVEVLERAILAHDPLLDPGGTAVAASGADPAAGEAAPDRPAVLRRLTTDLRWWLQAAAVLGERVTIAVVDAVVEAAVGDGGPVPGAGGPVLAAAAVEAGLLVDDGPGAARFAPGWRDTVLGTIDVFTLPRVHGWCAVALERLGALDDPVAVAAMAEHGDRSRGSGIVSDRLVDWLVRAGDVATVRRAHDEAVGWYRRALFAADRFGAAGRRTAIRMQLGEAHWRAGRPAEAGRIFLDLVDTGRRVGDRQLVVRATAGAVGWACVRDWLAFPSRPSAAAAPLLEDALAAVDDRDPASAAALLGPLAAVRASQARNDEADGASARAVALAEGSGDPVLLGRALAWRCVALVGAEHLGERRATAERLLALAEPVGAEELRHVALRHRVQCLVEQDRLVDARRELDALARCTAVLGDPVAERHLALLQTMFLLLDGRWEDAQLQAARALAIAEDGVDPDRGVLVHLIQVAVVHYNRNDDRELRAMAGLILANVQRAEAAPGVVGAAAWRPWYAVLCVIDLWTGHPDRARRRLRDLGRDRFAAVPRDQTWFGNMALLATAAALLHEAAAAADLVELLLPFAGRRAVVTGIICLAPVDYYLGILAATCGRDAEAERWLKDAVARCRQPGGGGYQAAQAMAHLAAVVSRRGDRRAADTLVSEAGRLATGLDLAGLAHHLQAGPDQPR